MRLRRRNPSVFELAGIVSLCANCSKSNPSTSGPETKSTGAVDAAVVSVLPPPVKAAEGRHVPTEPAVMRVNLSLADGGSCNAIVDGDCDDCLSKKGGNELPACDSLTGNATAGPAAGVARARLCHEALDCMRRTGCHANGVIDCYCGTRMTGGECNASAKAEGACKAELDRALEIRPGSPGSAALNVITEASTGGGTAGLIATVESSACSSVCMPYKASVCQ